MSSLAEYRRLEQQLALQLQALEDMKNNDGLQKELEFEGKLRALMAEYNVNLGGVISILDPQSSVRSSKSVDSTRKARDMKIYVHADTNERVETKGGNHKVLKAWKAEFGSEMVESWRIA
jgi:hypothetical protein